MLLSLLFACIPFIPFVQGVLLKYHDGKNYGYLGVLKLGEYNLLITGRVSYLDFENDQLSYKGETLHILNALLYHPPLQFTNLELSPKQYFQLCYDGRDSVLSLFDSTPEKSTTSFVRGARGTSKSHCKPITLRIKSFNLDNDDLSILAKVASLKRSKGTTTIGKRIKSRAGVSKSTKI